MVILIYYKQPSEDGIEFVYGIKEVVESSKAGFRERYVYAGHNINDLNEKIRELNGNSATIINLEECNGWRFPLDKDEESLLEKLLSKGNIG